MSNDNPQEERRELGSVLAILGDEMDRARRHWWLFLLLGIGQISAFMGATLLISAEAPKLKRGSVVGMFNTFGAIGIFVAVYFGGQLFDSVGGYAPFVLLGGFNAFVAVLAVVCRIFAPGGKPGGETTAIAH